VPVQSHFPGDVQDAGGASSSSHIEGEPLRARRGCRGERRGIIVSRNRRHKAHRMLDLNVHPG
jgi:hypothetical protein